MGWPFPFLAATVSPLLQLSTHTVVRKRQDPLQCFCIYLLCYFLKLTSQLNPLHQLSQLHHEAFFKHTAWYQILVVNSCFILCCNTSLFRLNSRKQLFNYNDDDHRVQSSIKFCSCVSNSIGISNVTCKYKASPQRHLGSIEGWVELVPPNGNIELKGSPNAVVILPLNEDDTNYEFEPENMTNVIPQWPTPSNRTKLAVEAYCNNIIRHSTSGKICSIIPSFPFHHFVLQCITDIQVV